MTDAAADTLRDLQISAPETFPTGSRAIVSGLQSRADLNGRQVAIIAWMAEKGRFAVRTMGASTENLLVRPTNLERCADPFVQLPNGCLALCFSALANWDSAARAASVCTRWNRILRLYAWPPCATKDLVPPRGWRRMVRFGHDWEERAPFAHPRAWLPGPTTLPSWTWALRGCDQPKAASIGLLAWVDRIEARWPGVAVPRWSGVARRLAWVQGTRTEPPILMWQLRGSVPRIFGRWGPREVSYSCYRSGASSSDALEPAPPCLFRLPADAALFFALFPSGVGEDECSDGAPEVFFAGYELTMEPWATTSAFYARANNLNNIGRMSASHLGCDPNKLLSFAHECLDSDFHSGDPSALVQTTLLLCCDEESKRYGQVFRCETVLRGGGGIAAILGWWEISFSQLLHAMLDTLDEALEPGSASGRRMAADSGQWDKAWQAKYGVAAMLRAKLDRTCYTPVQVREGGGGRSSGR